MRVAPLTFCPVCQSEGGVRQAGQREDGDAAPLCHGKIMFQSPAIMASKLHGFVEDQAAGGGSPVW